MAVGPELTIYLIVAVIAGAVAAIAARVKRRSTGFWMPVSFLFPPLVLILLLLPKRRAAPATAKDADGDDDLRLDRDNLDDF